MATKEEIRKGMHLFHENRPENAVQELHRVDNGIFAVLMFLSEQKEDVKSKDISDALHISTARMAVLLKKMEQKNLIVKSQSTSDGRATIVTLTKHGESYGQRIHLQLSRSVEQLIDQFGLMKIEDVFSCMNQFRNIMHGNMIEIMEEYND